MGLPSYHHHDSYTYSYDSHRAENLDHVQTVAKAKLGTAVTTLRPEKMLAIRSALAFVLAF